MRLSHLSLCVAMVAAGSSVWFVISTVVMDQLPRTALMAAALVVALAFVSAFAGTPLADRVRSAGRREVAFAAAAGVLTWFAPFALVLSQRATDAPSGTETLFFTTAGWVFAALLVSFAFREERPGFTRIAGSLLAVLGCAVLLANWERPSSFSPFIKFPAEEALILVAGALFALGLIAGRRSVRMLGARSALWVGVASAALIAVAVSIPAGYGTVASFGRIWPQLLIAGAALATLATGVSALVSSQGTLRATAWMALTPVALTGLSAVERLTGAYGPNPIVWLGAAGGGVLACLGVLVIQTSPTLSLRSATDTPTARTVRRWSLASIALAATATAFGVVSLFIPAVSADVLGKVESGATFSARWTLSGAEAASGWLALCVGLLALAVALDLTRDVSFISRLVAAVSGVVAVAMYPLVVATPLHTWNRWVPAEIQQAYGTEYARLTLEVVPQTVRIVALVLAVLVFVVVIVIMSLGRDTGGAARRLASEENA